MEDLKIWEHMKEVESVADIILEKQEKNILYDSLRQKNREAIRAVKRSEEESGWFCFSNQFFFLPCNKMVDAMGDDMKTFSDEIEKNRTEIKENINALEDLEGRNKTDFSLKPMSSGDFSMAEPLPHRRYNPLLDHWIIVSPQRINRPWSGESIPSKPHFSTEKGSTNYLQPGVTRANGQCNENYEQIFVFENDFPALSSASGKCEVMSFHRETNMSLACMNLDEITNVLKAWQEKTRMALDGKVFRWIQIFENHGEIVGCSNPHPHCQIWSSEFMPSIPSKMCKNLLHYKVTHGNRLFEDYVKREGVDSPRVVSHNEDWIIFVPWWAQWPFECLLLPRKNFALQYLHELTAKELSSLASIMKDLLCRYDNLFKCDFPYCFTWYQAPLKSPDSEGDHWTLHAIWYPPLLRSSSVRKFVAGYELFGELQRDLTAEQAAKLLREQSSKHYLSC